jgi:hypothetical protein
MVAYGNAKRDVNRILALMLMLRALHLAAAGVLFLAHGTFFFRGLYLRRAGVSPGPLDRAARTLAQILLLLAPLAGLALYLRSGRGAFLPHPALGLAPLAAVPLVSAGRILLHQRTGAPWLLPALNLALIAAALATGLAQARG